MKMARLLILALMFDANPATARNLSSCDRHLTDASAQYRDAFYQSGAQHRDVNAEKEALRAFRAIWNELVKNWAGCLAPGQNDNEEATQRLYAIEDIAAKAAAETEHGRFNQSYQTLRQIRPLLADMRHTDRLATFSDDLEAYDDKLAETADDDLDEGEISPDQFIQLCEQAGVLGYLGERLEKNAPTQWSSDPAFLDSLENLNRLMRGLKMAIFRGQRDPIRAALSDLRRDYDHFYLLYG
jgi:hypothetical protein